jgi:phosphatidylinositol glycan class B
LHPAIFAAVYLAADKPMEYLECFPQFRALVLSALPGATQAVFAGIGDFYTWQLAEKLYGAGSTTAWTTVSRSRADAL